MDLEKTSTLAFVWANRPGGLGVTKRRYRDVVVDGIALSAVFNTDQISPFGWGPEDAQLAAVDRLLRRVPGDLPEERSSLYVCAECGDLGCGAVSMVIEHAAGGIIWRDFAYQNNYDDDVHRDGFEDVGPFFFDGRAYFALIEDLRRDIQENSA